MKYLKQLQNNILQSPIILKKTDKHQGSGWVTVYRQDKYPNIAIRQLSENEKIKEYKFKVKLMKSNDNCNDWKFQLHWKNLEWLDPKNETVRRINSVIRLTSSTLNMEIRHDILLDT